MPTDGARQDRSGEAVNVKDSVYLEHVATSNFLSNDQIPYQTCFGPELEVSCMAAATKAKTQVLLNESQGTQVRENVHKQVSGQNLWKVCLADHPAQAEPVVAHTKHGADEVLDEVRKHLWKAPTLNFSVMCFGLCHKNDFIGVDELVWALHQLELVLNESDYNNLFAHYQKNWNQPKIEWRLFAENLRAEMTEAREAAIRSAYNQLDPEQTSKVALDDVAKLYNVTGAREVASGNHTEEQHYH